MVLVNVGVNVTCAEGGLMSSICVFEFEMFRHI